MNKWGCDPDELETIVQDQGWRRDAICVGANPDLFYPTRGGTHTDATAICQQCPVRWECLMFAMETHESWGVWGGLSEQYRRRIRALSIRAERNKQTFKLIVEAGHVWVLLDGDPVQITGNPRSGHTLSAEERRKIAELVGSGWTRYSVAALYGVSTKTVENVCKKESRR